MAGHVAGQVAVLVNGAAPDRQRIAPQFHKRGFQPRRAVPDHEPGPPEATRIKISEKPAPRCGARAAHIHDGKQHLSRPSRRTPMAARTEMLVALLSIRVLTTVPSRITRMISSPARLRAHRASRSDLTLRQARLTTSLLTPPPPEQREQREQRALHTPRVGEHALYQSQAIGRSRGGITTKIMALTPSRGLLCKPLPGNGRTRQPDRLPAAAWTGSTTCAALRRSSKGCPAGSSSRIGHSTRIGCARRWRTQGLRRLSRPHPTAASLPSSTVIPSKMRHLIENFFGKL